MTSFKDIALKRRALRAISAPDVGEQRLSARMMRGTEAATPVDRGEWNSIRALRKASVVKTAKNVTKKILDDARDHEREVPYPAVSLDLGAGTLSIGEVHTGRPARLFDDMHVDVVCSIFAPGYDTMQRPADLDNLLLPDVAEHRCLGPIFNSGPSRRAIVRLIDAAMFTHLAERRRQDFGELTRLEPLIPMSPSLGPGKHGWVQSLGGYYRALTRGLVHIGSSQEGRAPMRLSEATLAVTWLESWIAEGSDRVSTDGVRTNFGPIFNCVHANPGLGRWVVGVCNNDPIKGAAIDAEMKVRLIGILLSQAERCHDMRSFEQSARPDVRKKAKGDTQTSH
ncbi:hypothetical protein [Roseovarius sp. EL26]|uniref:hypothetical protein n=1 Tax=Roseovarius sp. EL26 TaxID=2126672 RepID=UPI000EA0392D|nr:hypothetical protein [Roseovarius sp. EL26]